MNDSDLLRKQFLKEYYGLNPDGVGKGGSWQDQNDRTALFRWLIEALDDRDMLMPGKRVYFPAANTQVETRAFAQAFPQCMFVGGDMEKSNVIAGKRRFTASANADLLVADAFYMALRNLDMIIDFGGAVWSASELYNRGQESAENVSRVFCEYHKALKKGGRVLIDHYSRAVAKDFSTVDLLEKNTPEIYEAMRSGRVRFRTGKRPCTVEAGTFTVDEYEAEFKVNELYVREGCRMYLLEKV